MEYFDYDTAPRFENHDWVQSFDVEQFLEQSQEREQQRLGNELARIEEQLEERDSIHEATISELESKLDWYLHQLEIMYQRNAGKTGRRDEVKSRIKEFYGEIRDEKRSHWADRQELEKERRTLLRLLEEVEDDEIAKLL